MSDPCQGLSHARHPEARLQLALATTQALAEHARALHLTEADELLAGLLALLLAQSATHEGTP
ncbi:hypothetical protein EAH89_30410 [Roseomonas nepalensis]|uniref:DUF2783 domain-containing protein n=1 Tax=Muricoccus nepalensis TaxID=1854500 RepID=A0A502EIC8_9PROT|nr:hypothetical protein [Roseomonas nepalensis]TPG36240.1 hypothetical protein EAH89_30410 [Roseomonas nepalensis]